MSYLPIIEILAAVQLMFIGFAVSTSGVFFMIMVKLIPALLVVGLVFDAGSRLMP